MPAPEQVVMSYFKALERGSYEALVGLFSKYAIVDSPLYGKMQASEWAKDFLQDTAKSKVTVLDIFKSDKFGSIAARFSCQWILRNSQFTSYEGVGIFQISPEDKIDKLTIIHDTANLRDAWNKGRK